MSKRIYNWAKVKPGDIISFRYKGNKPTGTLTTILVLNPKLPNKRQDGVTNFHLVGLKLEKQGVIPHIKNKEELVELLSRIGELQVVDSENQIYNEQHITMDGNQIIISTSEWQNKFARIAETHSKNIK